MDEYAKFTSLVSDLKSDRTDDPVKAVEIYEHNVNVMNDIKKLFETNNFENGFRQIINNNEFNRFIIKMTAKDVYKTMLLHPNCYETDFGNKYINSNILDNSDIKDLYQKGFSFRSGALSNFYGKPRNMFGIIDIDYSEILLSSNVFKKYIKPGNPAKAKKFTRKCPVCLTHVSKAKIAILKMAENCRCRLHLECALDTVKHQLDCLYDVNPLERKVPSCPGCQKEMLPSFYLALNSLFDMPVRKFVQLVQGKLLEKILEIFPEFEQLQLNEINKKILVLKFQNHPGFTLCPEVGCNGGAIVNPIEDRYTKCMVCQKAHLFCGKKVKIMPEEKQYLDILLSKTDGIRPCPHCGKVIEKNAGCDNMTCAFCNKHFNWMSSSYSKHKEIATF